MSSLNKVMLIGHVGRDPEKKSFPSGGFLVSFSLATSETWRDKQTGERREKVEWHNVVCKNETVGDVIARYVRKGARLYVEGRQETRKWTDRDGADRWTTEVVIPPYGGGVTLLDTKAESEARAAKAAQEDAPASAPRAPSARDDAAGGASGSAQGAPFDDDIPF